jgi:uncharacterized protein YkvS
MYFNRINKIKMKGYNNNLFLTKLNMLYYIRKTLFKNNTDRIKVENILQFVDGYVLGFGLGVKNADVIYDLKICDNYLDDLLDYKEIKVYLHNDILTIKPK